MKHFFILFFLIAGTFLQAQTSYTTHRVQKGETIFGIAKQYNTSEEEIAKLNPEVAHGLRENSVLIIPVSLQSNEDEDNLSFKEHKVKRKETIFGIATEYGVTVDDIKKYNKHLYSQELKKGETIRIPVKATRIITTQQEGVLPSGKHLVKPQETKFGIARLYGITIAELEALNPVIYGTDSLPVGIVLTVPEKKGDSQNTVIEEIPQNDPHYEYYTVKPKEGFYRLKVLFGLSEEEIVALNPNAKDGLKPGMVLKIPKNNTNQVDKIGNFESRETIYLENRLTNFKTKNVVVFLPLQLNKIVSDSLLLNENLLQSSPSLRISVDFYKGVLLATDYVKQKGISVNIHVFDYQEAKNGVAAFLDKKGIKDIDLIIGPLHQTDVEKVSSELQKKQIPVISPLSTRQSKMYRNFIQSIPSNNVLEETMLHFLKENYTGKNIIVISDSKKNASKKKITEAVPGVQWVDAGGNNYIKRADLEDKFSRTQPNWVFLETDKAILVSSVVNTLHSLSKTFPIRLFTLDKNEAFDFREVSNLHLGVLEFTYPAVQKPDLENQNTFYTTYKDLYKVYPNRFAVRGYDVACDALLRLATGKDIYDAINSIDGETVYVESKFYYVENSGGGYSNKACYVLQYTPELDIIEAVAE